MTETTSNGRCGLGTFSGGGVLVLVAAAFAAACGSPPAEHLADGERVETAARADDAHADPYQLARRGPDGLDFTNPAHGLRATFDPHGVLVAPDPGTGWSAPGGVWSVTLRTAAWGRQGALAAVPEVAPTASVCDAAVDACAARVEVVHGDLTAWWSNDARGLEQGWTVATRPVGDGPLLVDVAIEGARVAVDASGTRADLAPGGAGGTLSYDGLRAWDADGVALVASMEATDTGLRLTVRDDGARYPLTIDPVLGTQVWTTQLDVAGAHLGDTVADAGDVNGDGFSDVLVGAPEYTGTFTNEGAAHLYLGSATGLSTTPAWSVVGGQDGAYLGGAVAAGDLNGDGYSDLAVGCGSCRGTLAQEGEVRVYFGGPTGPASTPDWSAFGGQGSANFGSALAVLDHDGDGHGDLAVGAPYLDTTEPNIGRVVVFAGSSTGPVTSPPMLELTGSQAEGAFGFAVANLGDWNGDGYDDLVVGEPGYNANAGRVRGFFGKAVPDGAENGVVASGLADSRCGASIASGDLDGDGYSDLVVGQPRRSSGEAAEGYLSVSYGGSPNLVGGSWGFQPNEAGDLLGTSLAVGDVNGDGFADIAVGGERAPGGGAVWVLLGSTERTARAAHWRVDSPGASAEFGRSVAMPDVDRDGFADVLVGAPGMTDPDVDEGAVFLYAGGGSGFADTPHQTVTGGASFGVAVAGLGDVDGDGFDDLLLGDPDFQDGATAEGGVWLHRGKATGLTFVPSWEVQGGGQDERIGATLHAVGDVNGDGYVDVGVHRTNSRRAVLYLGGPSGLSTGIAWSRVTSAGSSAEVVGLGDVNGDGFDDVAVAMPEAGGVGRVEVFHGSPTGLVSSPAWTLDGTTAGDALGFGVAGVGDVNGDGYDDVAIGAPGEGTDGQVRLFTGSATGLSTLLWSHTISSGEGARFGASIDAAGDVDGDGFADVVIGAPDFRFSGGNRIGRVYVLRGAGSGVGSLAALTIGVQEHHNGTSVAGVGDVNGDGYADIVAGGPDHDGPNGVDAGIVRLWLGSSTGTMVLTSELYGRSAGDGFGAVVDAAGDLNGDGFDDLVVGTLGGRAHVFLGNLAAGSRHPQPAAAVLRRPGTSTPVPPGTWTEEVGAVDVALRTAWLPFGRRPVRLVVEAKPLGSPFDGTGLVYGDAVLPELDGAPLALPLTGLGAGPHHVRVQVLATQERGAQRTSAWQVMGRPGDRSGNHVNTSCRDGDGDGTCDAVDPCDGPDNVDVDGDGVCDTVDPCEGTDNVDADGDGVCDSLDPCTGPGTVDGDGDGLCDTVDPCAGADNVDADGDGVCDSLDLCAGDDATGDPDADGLCADLDLCPQRPDAPTTTGSGLGTFDVVDTCEPDQTSPPYPAGVCLHGGFVQYGSLTWTAPSTGTYRIARLDPAASDLLVGLEADCTATELACDHAIAPRPSVDVRLDEGTAVRIVSGEPQGGGCGPMVVSILSCVDADGDGTADGACLACEGDPAFGDDDGDGRCGDIDPCLGDETTGDADLDGVCDDLDVCLGDDATGDTDGDGVCDDGDTQTPWPLETVSDVSGANAVALDADQDGDLDLVYGVGDDLFLSEHVDHAERFTGTAVSLVTLGGPLYPATADFGGDGVPDLAIVASGGARVLRIDGVGDGTFGALQEVDASAPDPRLPAVGDVSGDGRIDLLVPAVGVNRIRSYLGTPTGELVSGPNATSSRCLLPTLADVDGDGWSDLFAKCVGVVRLMHNGPSGFDAGVPLDGTELANAFALVDLDGDGHLDLVYGNASALAVRDGLPGGAFAAARTVLQVAVQTLAVLDADGDGDPDVAVGTPAGELIVVPNDGGLTWRHTQLAQGLGPSGSLSAADLDGDGDEDLVYVRLDGLGVYAVRNPHLRVCDGDAVLGDVDGDGLCDDVDPCEGDNASGDTDVDGVCNDRDPCIGQDNVDADGDGMCDSLDLCPARPDFAEFDAATALGVIGTWDLCTAPDSYPAGACLHSDVSDVGVRWTAPTTGGYRVTVEGGRENQLLIGPDGDCAQTEQVCGVRHTMAPLVRDVFVDAGQALRLVLSKTGPTVCSEVTLTITACADDDGDLVCDDVDVCVGTDNVDTDGDGVCDSLDACAGDDATGDADGDAVCDDLDVCVGDDATGDDDSDGVCGDQDACVGDDSVGDTDLDGICDDGDLCLGDDLSGDSDLDGVCDDLDPCLGDDRGGDGDLDGVCDLALLVSDPVVAGSPVVLEIVNARPNVSAGYFVSVAGVGSAPCLPGGLGCGGLASPTLLGIVQTNDDGYARVGGTPPPSLAGRTVRFQAGWLDAPAREGALTPVVVRSVQ